MYHLFVAYQLHNAHNENDLTIFISTKQENVVNMLMYKLYIDRLPRTGNWVMLT